MQARGSMATPCVFTSLCIANAIPYGREEGIVCSYPCEPLVQGKRGGQQSDFLQENETRKVSRHEQCLEFETKFQTRRVSGKICRILTLVLSVKKGRGCDSIDSSCMFTSLTLPLKKGRVTRCIVLPSPFKGGTLWVKGRKMHRP
jgi:hypothetical protein